MRTGGFVVSQHALSDESASIIRQSITLAKQRGHAQVTPLHVATTMLITSSSSSSLSSLSSSSSSSSSTSTLLRRACLQTLPQSHPLQSKALDLCFNVALNRLPATTPSSHHQRRNPPSISNALVAAFKRAQAHQRRGATDSLQQQQSLLTMKIELDQLIISILDDPSVSRVLKEAGFSSSHVKSNVEEALASLDTISLQSTSVITTGGLIDSKAIQSNMSYCVRHEDVMCVIESLMDRRRRGIVVVGEKIEVSECVIRGVMDKLKERNDQDHRIPENLRDLKFLDVSFYSFEHLSREKVEKQLEDVKSEINKYMKEGVVLYLGDVKWVAEYRANNNNNGAANERNCCYCPIEHITMELGNFGEIDNGRVWLLGIATFQGYMRCKSGCPSLETVWRLHPLPVPAGSFSLSLTTDSDQESQLYADPSRSPRNESQSVLATTTSNGQSTLPTWLQHPKDDHNKPPSRDGDGGDDDDNEEVLIMNNPGQHPLWHSNANSDSTVVLSDDDMVEIEYVQRFKEFNAQNLKILCDALENRVPRYKHVVPDIAATILQCRSGMRKRGKDKNSKSYTSKDIPQESKYETWFLFQGCDMETKEKIGRELAKVIFGSHSKFINIGWHEPRCHGSDMVARDNSSICSHECGDQSTEEQGRIKKLKFDVRNLPYTNGFVEALCINPHRVFLLEDVDKMETGCQWILERAIAGGRLEDSKGKEVDLSDAIIIITSASSSSPSLGHGLDLVQKETNTFRVSLDLNISNGKNDVAVIKGRCVGIGLLESVDRCITFNI